MGEVFISLTFPFLLVAKAHFFSSDESEEEEDRRKKFKIKIKPLPADHVVSAPSVDELKASIGNIALSPSPLVSSPDVTIFSLQVFIYRDTCVSVCSADDSCCSSTSLYAVLVILHTVRICPYVAAWLFIQRGKIKPINLSIT